MAAKKNNKNFFLERADTQLWNNSATLVFDLFLWGRERMLCEGRERERERERERPGARNEHSKLATRNQLLWVASPAKTENTDNTLNQLINCRDITVKTFNRAKFYSQLFFWLIGLGELSTVTYFSSFSMFSWKIFSALCSQKSTDIDFMNVQSTLTSFHTEWWHIALTVGERSCG